MVKFDYLPDGRITGLRDVFSSFNEPSDPIPPEVTALTGITNDMVAGHRIDEAAVSSFAPTDLRHQKPFMATAPMGVTDWTSIRASRTEKT